MDRDESANVGGDRQASGEWGSLERNRERADLLIQRIDQSSHRTNQAVNESRAELEQIRAHLGELAKQPEQPVGQLYHGEFQDPAIRAEYESYLDVQERQLPDRELEH